ncbi:18002_t:CDS:2 [Entrophospora sp. SA101]|nr:18002_t:CDS:2 [Entrophospora sp. SA101]CAJ0864107.1 12631_t:CDS:2 [Entrophospora sp. SA101]
MGWEYKAHSKDLYFDGHERPDVVKRDASINLSEIKAAPINDISKR